jgi:hypothetical protein
LTQGAINATYYSTAAIPSTPANDANHIIILQIGLPSILVQCSRPHLSICSGVARPRSCSSYNGIYSDSPAMSARDRSGPTMNGHPTFHRETFSNLLYSNTPTMSAVTDQALREWSSSLSPACHFPIYVKKLPLLSRSSPTPSKYATHCPTTGTATAQTLP